MNRSRATGWLWPAWVCVLSACTAPAGLEPAFNQNGALGPAGGAAARQVAQAGDPAGAGDAAPTAPNAQAAQDQQRSATPSTRHVVAPDRAREESSGTLHPASCGALETLIPRIPSNRRIVEVEAFGAKGDASTDDSAAINAAIRSLGKGGGVVRFRNGKTYLKRGVLEVAGPEVTLSGYGATILAATTDHEVEGGKARSPLAIKLLGTRASVYGLTIISNLRTRLVGHPNDSAIYLAGPNQSVVDVRIEYTGIGVLIENATGFTVARNVVYRTLADGIHVTNGSSDGKIVCNTVRQTGDDMIAVVNYGLGRPTVSRILIAGNDVEDQYWGRGITVVGGRDITIRGNRISRTTHGAGILIASERSYWTANVENVLIESNDIFEVQTTDANYNPIRTKRKTGHGAIHLDGQEKQEVRGVLIRHNRIAGSRSSGIRVVGRSCDVGILDNELQAIGGAPVKIDSDAGEGCQFACNANVADGQAVVVPNCTGQAPSVTGSGQL